MADTYEAIQPSTSLSPVSHPLEPLTAEEINAAVQIVRTERKLSECVRFASVSLYEPTKEVVLNFKAGDPISRAALIILQKIRARKPLSVQVGDEAPFLLPAVVGEQTMAPVCGCVSFFCTQQGGGKLEEKD